MTIWIELFPETKLMKKPKIVCGISCIDIISGDVYTFENCEEYFHNPITFDEVERFYSSYRPKELVIIHNCKDDKIKDIISYADIDSNLIHEFNIDNVTGNWKTYIDNCCKETYHEVQLTKYYKIKDYDAFYDSYKLRERKFSTQSLVFLLNFLDIHNHNLVHGLKYPNFVNIDEQMRLANHSLKQLNIIQVDKKGKFSSLEKLVNVCKTSMGKRYLRNKLLNPTCNKEYLNNEYEIQDYVQENIEWENMFNNLSRVTDLERLYRKTILNRVAPSDISNLYDNLKQINKLYKQTKIDDTIKEYLINGNLSKSIKNLQQKIKSCVNLSKSSEISSTEFDENIFIRGIDHEDFIRLDKAEFDYIDKVEKLEAIRKYLDSKIIEKSKKNIDKVKYHKTEKSGTFLVITKNRWKKLQPTVNKKTIKLKYKVFEKPIEYVVNLSDITNNPATGSNIRIDSKEISKLYGEILTKKAIFKEILMAVYRNYISSFNEFKHNFDTIIEFIQKTDFLFARIKVFNDFNYCKPIINDNQDQSYFIAKDIRHPLIEHIQDKEIYVPNDVSLGVENEETGICLYGTNAVGKSSLIRSIGMSLVLAQAGFYVPCSEFTYKPYTAIFTRILGNDNIFKGLSTFAVEMSELGSILRGANKNTLVLGDELCTGTETTSAFCIIQAGLMWLHERNSSFIFATHFHELAEKIKALKRLKMKHMVVEHDEKTGCLIYYRKLKDGNGSRLYGLEVCKSMPMPREFLDLANSFRYSDVSNETLTLSRKKVKYNSKKLKDICELCGEKGVDIHHMIPQNKANSKGFIGSVHKNHKANLMNICKECHENVTKNNIVHKRVKTTNGNTFIEINM